jgi:hypothetical protein
VGRARTVELELDQPGTVDEAVGAGRQDVVEAEAVVGLVRLRRRGGSAGGGRKGQ